MRLRFDQSAAKLEDVGRLIKDSVRLKPFHGRGGFSGRGA